MQESPISKLFVSSSQIVNEQEMYELLHQYISIEKDTNEIVFLPLFHDLSNVHKIMILLAAVKAKAVYLKTDDKITPSEIIAMEIMPTGSVKGTLKTLLDDREIKAENGKYFLPAYKIPHLRKTLLNNPN